MSFCIVEATPYLQRFTIAQLGSLLTQVLFHLEARTNARMAPCGYSLCH